MQHQVNLDTVIVTSCEENLWKRKELEANAIKVDKNETNVRRLWTTSQSNLVSTTSLTLTRLLYHDLHFICVCMLCRDYACMHQLKKVHLFPVHVYIHVLLVKLQFHQRSVFRPKCFGFGLQRNPYIPDTLGTA